MNESELGYCELTLSIVAQSDILVGKRTAPAKIDGQEKEVPAFFQGIDPTTGKPNCVIPATSLKGVLRSISERILRSFDLALACDPFIGTDGQQAPESVEAGLRVSCSKRLENGANSNGALYAQLCPACRLFGATVHRGLLAVEDAVLDVSSEDRNRSKNRPPDGVLRTRIGIDRWSGEVRQTIAGKGSSRKLTGATQSQLVLPPGSSFNTTLKLHNFALWQLGLVALALGEINEGWARIGSGTRKGMGQVKAEITDMQFRYPARLYDEALQNRPAEQAGVLSAPQTLGNVVTEPEVAAEQLWFGGDLPRVEGQHWYDRSWVAFKVQAEQVRSGHVQEASPAEETEPDVSVANVSIPTILQHAVEKSLGPRLQAGLPGFYQEGV
jgi:CRISPR/Cas system CSM-associated protein Csm3 (group 7 of RAMP superfamily)